MDRITKEYAEQKGWQVNGHLIKLTKRQWSKYPYASFSIRHPGKRTLLVPTTDGTAVLVEGIGFEIV